MKEFLKLPIRFGDFFEKKKLATCTLSDSIYRNLHLLITTVPGENKADSFYGSDFWDADYDIHMANDTRRELVINSLKKQIQAYEKRISHVQVDVNVKLAMLSMGEGLIQRRKVEIVIKGKIIRSNEPFSFQTGFFIGPLTLD